MGKEDLSHLNSPARAFDEPTYYSDLIKYLGNNATVFNQAINAYVNTTDATVKQEKERFLLRLKHTLLTNIWKEDRPELNSKERLFTRFSLLHPKLLGEKLKSVIGPLTSGVENVEHFYYADEWVRAVALGQRNSFYPTEEMEMNKKKSGADSEEVLEDLRRQDENLHLRMNDIEHDMEISLEDKNSLLSEIASIATSFINEHSQSSEVEALDDRDIDELKGMVEKIKGVVRSNNNHRRLLANLEVAKQTQEKLVIQQEALTSSDSFDELGHEDGESGRSGHGFFDVELSHHEAGNLLEMIKLTEGPTGNKFPFLSETFIVDADKIGTKKRIHSILKELEERDPEVFYKVVKKERIYMHPNILIVPSYGSRGVCWQIHDPMDRNKKTSRGLLGVGLYGQNVKLGLTLALANFRWLRAKEDGGAYWLQEGLTGEYLYYLMQQKISKDPKKFFIPDYVLWITKESEGIQKLHKTVREMFWRYMPFSEERRDSLASVSPIYGELRRKDKNRERKNKNKAG